MKQWRLKVGWCLIDSYDYSFMNWFCTAFAFLGILIFRYDWDLAACFEWCSLDIVYDQIWHSFSPRVCSMQEALMKMDAIFRSANPPHEWISISFTTLRSKLNHSSSILIAFNTEDHQSYVQGYLDFMSDTSRAESVTSQLCQKWFSRIISKRN